MGRIRNHASLLSAEGWTSKKKFSTAELNEEDDQVDEGREKDCRNEGREENEVNRRKRTRSVYLV